MATYQSSDTGTYYRPPSLGGLRFFPPVIKALLFSNVAIWLLTDFFLAPFRINNTPVALLITEFFALWPLGDHFLPWQLLTYMFIHGGFGHLFFNMLALWMFGMELENTWGSRAFAIYYLLCGVGAAITNLLVAPLIGQAAPTVGASGAIFGVLIAFGMMFPDRPIYLYFLLPIRAKYFIAAYIGLELFYGVTGTPDGIAHFAHLGGAVVGFVYMLVAIGWIPLRSWWTRLWPSSRNVFPTSGRVFRRTSGGGEVHEAKFYEIKSGRPSVRDEEVNQELIDAILDKISKGGYQSLTEEEKRILNEASKKIH